MLKKFLVSVSIAVWAMIACSPSMADTSLGLRVGTLGGGIDGPAQFTVADLDAA